MTKRLERLNEFDERVLLNMSRDFARWIKFMALDTRLPERQVRRSYRKLKRMGLAYFSTCWNEDESRPSGSGYFLTPDGVAARDSITTKA